ncbi:peptidylprolyl isomerase [Sedimentimonas flavescens]|uniref:peptidylprolyl isomerase n=1 Tax=Sedimentimonas flavescens TaxID=2851012 RepID=UPI001C4A00E9|nr:peptidylprolyl isomerase [Sedimentimonas flavescens]MBW0157257.1 peptidylprolyl isomerase [Sedimentimonas flavescens]WBL34437.1 peptidylprolyl isomerase [Sinirhodobacter sp. HNIBRBA609]
MRKILLATALAFAATGAWAEGSGVPDTDGPNLTLEIGGSVSGNVVIDLLPDVAPKHVEQIVALAKEGAYDDVIFHRVIEGFMAQTGDVQFGKRGGDTRMAGVGGSERPDLPAEFSNRSFTRGMVGMARSADPNSANSQFFIMFQASPHLDGQYTIVGHVVEGLEIVDQIQKGDMRQNGLVDQPDYIVHATVE